MAADHPTRIFLSPHPDDIAYSCYGPLVNPPVPRLDSSLILTVFSVSRHATGELGRRGCQHEVTRVRKAEDETFASSVGCRLLSLDFPDSSVRNETNDGPQFALQDSTRHPMFAKVKAAMRQKHIPPNSNHPS